MSPASRHRRRSGPPVRRSYCLRHRGRLDAHLRRHRPRLRRGRGRARARGVSARATSSRSCCRPGPSTCSRTAARPSSARSPPASTTGSRRRERDAVLDVADPKLVDSTPRRRRRSTTCSPTTASPGTPPRSPTIPTGRSRSSSRRARPGCPKGALYCNRQLAFITADRRRRHVGRRRPLVHRHVVRAPRLHDEAARQPAARRHDLHHGRAGARADALELLEREQHDDRRGRADPARADAARIPTSTPSTSRRVQFIIVGRRAGHARPRRGSAPPLRRAARDALLVHRGRHRARHRVRRSRGGRDRERRPPARERRARGPRRRRTRRCPRARSAQVCLRSPAVMAGYWRDPEQTAAALHRRRLRAHRRPRLGRRPRPPAPRRSQQGDVRARRLQRLSGRGRRRALDASRTSRRSRSCRAPTT